MNFSWIANFEERTELKRYESNAIGLFALLMKFDIDDIETIASDSVVDGKNDKKCDILYINKEEKYAVLMQCYNAQTQKPAAPANKAADLNTALSWFIVSPEALIPEEIKFNALQLREAIKGHEIDKLYIWYTHNCLESETVAEEMLAVENTASQFLNQLDRSDLQIEAKEIGCRTLESWYTDTQTPILVSEEFSISSPSGFYEISGADWSAIVTTLNAQLLHGLYKQHSIRLFSANVRDYLGSRSTDSNINNGIVNSAKKSSENFWIYNNGITAIVNDYQVKEGSILVSGLSIVNGAQTTGAIGSLNEIKKDFYIPIRLIKTDNQDVIQDVIRFNNSQNKVSASDFRSTDKTQKRLREEFKKIPSSEYDGGRRGSASNIISRKPNLLPSYTVGQALAAFHRDPIIAYNRKTDIWADDGLYSKYFSDSLTAKHIVFTFSLLRSIESHKMQLLNKHSEGEILTNIENEQLQFFRKRGSIFLFLSAISDSLELIIGNVGNPFRLAFKENLSPIQASLVWQPLISTSVHLISQLDNGMSDGLKNTERVNQSIKTFKALFGATLAANSSLYDSFKERVEIIRS